MVPAQEVADGDTVRGCDQAVPPRYRRPSGHFPYHREGEFVYLVGPTGSGKTTLLRLVTRELVPTKGRVTVGDVNIRKIASHNLAYLRRNIGVVFQDFRLLPDLTVYENIAFVQEVIGVSSHDVQKRTNDVLDRLGLWRRRSLFPEQLSGGNSREWP